MGWILVFYLLGVLIWGVLSYFPVRDLYEFGFVGDATILAVKIYLGVGATLVVLGLLAIIFA
ncbi:hypothetical protein J7L13_02305 [bacterium]|nr:hypothetical protein [bacterium]